MNPEPISAPAIVETVNADNYIALKNVINQNLARLDQLTSERKIHKEKLANILTNNETFAEAEENLKNAQRYVKACKSVALATQEAQTISAQIKEKNEEIKEIQEALSSHLTNYSQITGICMIEDADGVERTFSVKATIKPKQLKLFGE